VSTQVWSVTSTTPRLYVHFTCNYATDKVYGKVCVHTLPDAALTITVRYCTGRVAVSRSLKGTAHATQWGNRNWSWTPDTKCRGTAYATVIAHWHGQSATNTVAFVVQ
jgi:hypothetical protein